MIIKNTVTKKRLNMMLYVTKEDGYEFCNEIGLVNVPFMVCGPDKRAGIKPVTQDYATWDMRLDGLQSKINKCLKSKDCSNLRALVRRQTIMWGEKNHQIIRDYRDDKISLDTAYQMIKEDNKKFEYMIQENIKGNVI